MIDAVADLSHWQGGPSGGAIDFVAMRQSGVLAVLLKATQGALWTDATFKMRAQAANTAGLMVGAYHFCDSGDPESQVEHFLAVAGPVSRLAIDIEPNSLPSGTVSITQAAEIVARIQMAAGKLPLAYIGRWGIDGRGTGLPNQVLARCDLWLPEYGTDPVPPAGWSDWTLWQYTETGSVSGVQGPCDRNRFNGTIEELQAWW